MKIIYILPQETIIIPQSQHKVHISSSFIQSIHSKQSSHCMEVLLVSLTWIKAWFI